MTEVEIVEIEQEATKTEHGNIFDAFRAVVHRKQLLAEVRRLQEQLQHRQGAGLMSQTLIGDAEAERIAEQARREERQAIVRLVDGMENVFGFSAAYDLINAIRARGETRT